jgi:hypothetical protein
MAATKIQMHMPLPTIFWNQGKDFIINKYDLQEAAKSDEHYCTCMTIHALE